MPGLREAVAMYYALTAELRAVLERCWTVSMLGSANFERCRSGLGPGFWRNFGFSIRKASAAYAAGKEA